MFNAPHLVVMRKIGTYINHQNTLIYVILNAFGIFMRDLCHYIHFRQATLWNVLIEIFTVY